MALRGFTCRPSRRSGDFSCGGPQRKDALYIKQYNWHASGQPTVYPFVDDRPAAVEKDPAPPPPLRQRGRAASSSSTPGVRCGSKMPGRIVKPGRLATNSVYHYAGYKHVAPSKFLYVEGRHWGWTPLPPPPPDPAPDEEVVPVEPKAPSRRAERMSNAYIKSESDVAAPENADDDSTINNIETKEVVLHKSAISLNVSIQNLGADFKRQKILERLKLLDAVRSAVNSQEDITIRQNLIQFSSEEPSDDDGEEIRSCSTCDGSIDFLSCSKPENQRKSLNMWRVRDERELARAFEKVAGQLGTPDDQKSGQTNSPSESVLSGQDLRESDEKPLHASKHEMNLSIDNMERVAKRQKILEKLEIINAKLQQEPGGAGQFPLGLRHSSEKDDFFIVLDDDGDLALEGDDDDQTRECDTCKNSLDRLDCSVPANVRRTFQLWREKDIADVLQAVETVSSGLRSPRQEA